MSPLLRKSAVHLGWQRERLKLDGLNFDAVIYAGNLDYGLVLIKDG